MRVSFKIGKVIIVSKEFSGTEQIKSYLDGLLTGLIHSNNAPDGIAIELYYPGEHEIKEKVV
jgi:hypothetical protein